jgi:hypothetical protein
MNNAKWPEPVAQNAAWNPAPAPAWPVAGTLNEPITPAPEAPSPYDSLTKDQCLMLHKQKQEDLAKLKDEEMELRKYIVKKAFAGGKEGTNTQELGNGYELKATIKYNYTLDTDLDKVEDVLDKIAKIGNEGAFIADRLVTWSASFKVGEYRPLCEPDASPTQKKIKALIDSILTISEAAPTLEIKEPKKSKK